MNAYRREAEPAASNRVVYEARNSSKAIVYGNDSERTLVKERFTAKHASVNRTVTAMLSVGVVGADAVLEDRVGVDLEVVRRVDDDGAGAGALVTAGEGVLAVVELCHVRLAHRRAHPHVDAPEAGFPVGDALGALALHDELLLQEREVEDGAGEELAGRARV